MTLHIKSMLSSPTLTVENGQLDAEKSINNTVTVKKVTETMKLKEKVKPSLKASDTSNRKFC